MDDYLALALNMIFLRLLFPLMSTLVMIYNYEVA